MPETYYTLECGHFWAHSIPALDGCPFCEDYTEAMTMHAILSIRQQSGAQSEIEH